MRTTIARFFTIVFVLLAFYSVSTAQLFIRDTTFLSIRDTAGTADVDLTTIPNRIILLTGTNTNLALNKPVTVIYKDALKISTHPTASNPQLMTD